MFTREAEFQERFPGEQSVASDKKQESQLEKAKHIPKIIKGSICDDFSTVGGSFFGIFDYITM